jgi:hypothetical protein
MIADRDCWLFGSVPCRDQYTPTCCFRIPDIVASSSFSSHSRLPKLHKLSACSSWLSKPIAVSGFSKSIAEAGGGLIFRFRSLFFRRPLFAWNHEGCCNGWAQVNCHHEVRALDSLEDSLLHDDTSSLEFGEEHLVDPVLERN